MTAYVYTEDSIPYSKQHSGLHIYILAFVAHSSMYLAKRIKVRRLFRFIKRKKFFIGDASIQETGM